MQKKVPVHECAHVPRDEPICGLRLRGNVRGF